MNVIQQHDSLALSTIDCTRVSSSSSELIRDLRLLRWLSYMRHTRLCRQDVDRSTFDHSGQHGLVVF